MGYDFYNERGECFGLHSSSWPMAYDLAVLYGWQPAGTGPSVDPQCVPKNEAIDLSQMIQEASVNFGSESNGSYFGNDWQVVHGADALRLAAALERAVAELPDEDLCPVKIMKLINRHGRPIEVKVLADNAHDDPKLYWSGTDSKARLREFINFCRQGSFAIG